jgi:SDR family mycofactocin-dependent oxidoreductase
MGRLEGRVAFISGAARGQGRSHALKLAEEGADIIAFDLCADMATVTYRMGTLEQLEETAELVRQRGRRVITRCVDVRDLDAVIALAQDGHAAFGRIDIASANAGIGGHGATTWELTEEQWTEMVDTNLTGVFDTMSAVLPAMIDGGGGGAIVATSSGAIFRSYTGTTHYTAAKYGVVGLIRALALEVASYDIRVNALAPTAVNTPMISANPTSASRHRPDLENPVFEDMLPGLTALNAMPVPYIDTDDVSEALLWLVSDEARHITGQVLPIDAGLAIAK